MFIAGPLCERTRTHVVPLQGKIIILAVPTKSWLARGDLQGISAICCDSRGWFQYAAGKPHAASCAPQATPNNAPKYGKVVGRGVPQGAGIVSAVLYIYWRPRGTGGPRAPGDEWSRGTPCPVSRVLCIQLVGWLVSHSQTPSTDWLAARLDWPLRYVLQALNVLRN